MSDPAVIAVLVGLGVIALVGGVGFALSRSASVAEQRLDEHLAGGGRSQAKSEAIANLLLRPPASDLAGSRFWAKVVPNVANLHRLYEQADVNLPFQRFLAIAAALAATGAVVGFVLGLPPLLIPLGSATLGGLPFLWLVWRKRRRIRKFLAAMPEAVELVARALRAGHSLASGLHLVAEEMRGPIADEFGRVFEEQNLGIPIEVSLRGLSERIPSMDVKFFVIAVVIQRSTGGDLAEVLDKIGRLIRQRFELFGHVRALTAEGRLSGIVLLALPPGLLAFLCMSNYDYISVLFTTPIGTKMMAITAVLQMLGAAMIKKIVAIKV
jgi:tight adherence protein B